MIYHYLNTAFRHFRQHKVTTGINVVCLALGLASFLLAWGITDYFARADAYHARAARTVVLPNQPRDTPLRMHTTSWLLGEHLRADFPELEAVSRALWPQELPLVTDTGSAGTRANSFAAVSY